MSDQKTGLEEVLKGLFSMVEEGDRNAFESVREISQVESAREAGEAGDYEKFYFEMVHPVKKAIRGLAAHVTDNARAQFLLAEGVFVERHFKALFEEYEGSPYCADKARHAVRSLIRFYMSGKEIRFDYGQKYTYFLPSKIFKTHEALTAFCAALERLIYGRSKEYVQIIENLKKEHAPV